MTNNKNNIYSSLVDKEKRWRDLDVFLHNQMWSDFPVLSFFRRFVFRKLFKEMKGLSKELRKHYTLLPKNQPKYQVVAEDEDPEIQNLEMTTFIR